MLKGTRVSTRVRGPAGFGAEPHVEDAPLAVRKLIVELFRRDAVVVMLVALTFKLGLHMAGALLKPMAVDYGWTKQQIGAAVVSVGSISALAGAAVGGLAHRLLREKRALFVALMVQALVCAPLVAVDRLHAPIALTTFAIGMEHFGTGFGTTVLFAALMTATRPANAGLHYTILTSLNNVAIGVGGQLGGFSAQLFGKQTTFIVATIVCLLPPADSSSTPVGPGCNCVARKTRPRRIPCTDDATLWVCGACRVDGCWRSFRPLGRSSRATRSSASMTSRRRDRW